MFRWKPRGRHLSVAPPPRPREPRGAGLPGHAPGPGVRLDRGQSAQQRPCLWDLSFSRRPGSHLLPAVSRAVAPRPLHELPRSPGQPRPGPPSSDAATECPAPGPAACLPPAFAHVHWAAGPSTERTRPWPGGLWGPLVAFARSSSPVRDRSRPRASQYRIPAPAHRNPEHSTMVPRGHIAAPNRPLPGIPLSSPTAWPRLWPPQS